MKALLPILSLFLSFSAPAQTVGWKEYVDSQFRAMKESTALALDAQKEAVIKAEKATELRFESVNEFRAAMSDQQAHYVSRELVESKFAQMQAEINALKEQQVKLVATGTGIGTMIGWIVGGLGFVLLIMNLWGKMSLRAPLPAAPSPTPAKEGETRGEVVLREKTRPKGVE